MITFLKVNKINIIVVDTVCCDETLKMKQETKLLFSNQQKRALPCARQKSLVVHISLANVIIEEDISYNELIIILIE